MTQLPVFQTISADFSYTIKLENQIVTLRFKWNVRAGNFFLDFTDAGGNSLYGIKLLPNWPLLKYGKGNIDRFSGDLMIFQAENSAESEITYDNLGVGWILYYLSQEEVSAWEAENGLE